MNEQKRGLERGGEWGGGGGGGGGVVVVVGGGGVQVDKVERGCS
jgi:hypothetical protein